MCIIPIVTLGLTGLCSFLRAWQRRNYLRSKKGMEAISPLQFFNTEDLLLLTLSIFLPGLILKDENPTEKSKMYKLRVNTMAFTTYIVGITYILLITVFNMD
jgi:hypothetical protein